MANTRRQSILYIWSNQSEFVQNVQIQWLMISIILCVMRTGVSDWNVVMYDSLIVFAR